MTDNEIEELTEHLDEMTDDRGYTELHADRILNIAFKAALFVVKEEEYWLPYSHLRHHDGEIYATEWILKQKGLF